MENERIGHQFGIWKLTKLIGRGGMGDVYLADRLDGVVKQQAAVKVLLRSPSTGFLDEAATLRSLGHPNIVRYFDSGLTADGLRYLVMEYVDGVPITDYADQKGLMIRERLGLFLHACDAVACAHQYLILHLDLKPSNVLVSKDGVVKVLDFGMARRLDDGEVEQPLSICSGPYASPEQVQPPGRRLGYATDTYGLGAILYELLSGHEPFNRYLASGELERQIAEETPCPPSEAINQSRVLSIGQGKFSRVEPERLARMRGGCTLPKARKLLAGNLDRICLYALRKESGRRYKTVDDLRSDIGEVLKGEPPEFAHPNDLGYLAWRTAQQRPLVVAGVVFAIASSYSQHLVMSYQSDSKRASIESKSQIDQVAEGTMKALIEELRPKLASDPRLHQSLEVVDAERKALTPTPASTSWEQIQRQKDGPLDRIRRMLSQ